MGEVQNKKITELSKGGGGRDKVDFIVTQSKSLSVIGIAEVMGSSDFYVFTVSDTCD